MTFLTDRKRATGLGSSKTGTEHHWHMMVSSAGLALLVPLFILNFGSILGAPYEEVIAHYSKPYPAIVAALTLVAGFLHFKNGVQATIEDYTQGLTRKSLLIATTCFCYAAAGTGIFSIARIAL
ncbi:MAG: succinate dehydrogenase, hydrophobic membrane anchor protein [Pseudomonadota bacterium]